MIAFTFALLLLFVGEVSARCLADTTQNSLDGRACGANGGTWDASVCTCTCAPRQLCSTKLDLLCNCLPAPTTTTTTAAPPTCDSVAATRCVTAGGRFDQTKCQCVFPQTTAACDVATLSAKCTNAGGKFDSTSCTCITPTTTPTCDSVAATRCVSSGGKFDSSTCQCVFPPTTTACDVATLSAKCTSAGGKFDSTSCTCITSTPSCADLATRCATTGGTFDQTKCVCTPPSTTTCDVATLSAKCSSVGGKFDSASCTCITSTPSCADLATRCATTGGTFDQTKCICTPPSTTPCDVAALTTRCTSAGGKFDSTTCTCIPGCDAVAMKARCTSANLQFVPETCSCTQATTCDATRLANVCASVTGATANLKLCICEILCADGTPASDAATRCKANGGVVTDFNKCVCQMNLDACSLAGIDAAAAEMRCVNAGYDFDRASCKCVPKQVVCDLKCDYKLDATACRCIPAPCALTADRAALAAMSCAAQGFRFDDTTCSCVQVCLTGQFAGVAVDAAYARCTSANGMFAKEGCVCTLPTTTGCTTRVACDPGRVFNAKTCACEEGCPDGRLYADAKAACLIAGSTTNIWEPTTCSCTRTCAGDLATATKARCDSVKGTFDPKTCGCVLPKCDLSTVESAQLRSDCSLRGWVFNADCTCTAPVSTEPTCPNGGDYAQLKMRCLSTSGNSWDPATCSCRSPCLARDAASAMKTPCKDTQVYDAASCACIDQCAASKRYDVAADSCSDGTLFDRTTCSCVAAPCDPRAATTQASADMCAKAGNTFDYLNCKCNPATPPATCSDETRKALQARCAQQMWVWSDEKCLCSAPSQIKVKLMTDAVQAEFLQRLQLLVRACNIKVDTSVAGAVTVTFSTGGAEALNCVVNNDALVKTLAADGAVTDVSVEALSPVLTEVPAMMSSSAFSVAVSFSAAILAVLVAMF